MEILMNKLMKIKNFEQRVYEKRVDVKRADKALVELIMYHSKNDEEMDDPVDKAVDALNEEERVKQLTVETIPYFIES